MDRMTRKIPTTIKDPELVRERQHRIFQAALKLFTKNGYHDTSVRELSKESGIGLSNIYDYIGKKSDILYLLYQKLLEIITEEIKRRMHDSDDPLQKLTIMIETELASIDQYQDLLMIVYQESHAMNKPSLRSMLSHEEWHMELYKRILEEGIESGFFLKCNTTALASIIRLMIDGWVLRRWALRGKVNLDEMKNSVIQIVMTGIINSKSDRKLMGKLEQKR